MLLNNCLLTFRSFEGEIPANLLFPVYYELIKLQRKKDFEDVKELFHALYEKYNSFSIEDKNKYSKNILELIFIIASIAYEIEDYHLLGELVDESVTIYSDYRQNDENHLYYAKTIALYGNFLFNHKMYHEAFQIFLDAYHIVKLVPDSDKEKTEDLSRLSFSLGNILFQADQLTDAQDYFNETIRLCKNNEFESKFTLLHMAYNYLSQVYVCLEEYDNAINTLLEYLDLTKDLYNDDNQYICAEFHFRIGFIYNKFKNDKESTMKFMQQAKDILDMVSDKTEKVNHLLSGINHFLIN